MKIYTRKGDSGETGLYGNVRVPKDDLRLRSYGTLDELNAALGLALSEESLSPELRQILLRVQGELFQLGAELATPRGKDTGARLLEADAVERLEGEIDSMDTRLPGLKTFILPGGSRASAGLHLARTISRRAEREITTLNRADSLRPVVLQYMNRLSDHLFVCARLANAQAGHPDTPWESPVRDTPGQERR